MAAVLGGNKKQAQFGSFFSPSSCGSPSAAHVAAASSPTLGASYANMRSH